MARYARCAALAGLLGVGFATAAVAEDPEGNVWVWFRPGGIYTDLGTGNDFIDAGNEIFEDQGWATLDSFHLTYDVSAEVHANITERVTAYGGYGSTFGSVTQNFDRVISAEVSGNPITGGVLYRVPLPDSWRDAVENLDVFAGAGVVYMSNFEYRVRDEDLKTDREFLEERIFSGDGLGFELRLNAEYFLSPKFTMMAGFSYRALTASDLTHEVRVSNPNVFNPTEDDDGDGIRNDRDPDYLGENLIEGSGNFQRMYGRPIPDPENEGEFIWSRPADRFLEPFYKFDPGAFANEAAPAALRGIYDPSAKFDMELSGIQLRIGLSYYIF